MASRSPASWPAVSPPIFTRGRAPSPSRSEYSPSAWWLTAQLRLSAKGESWAQTSMRMVHTPLLGGGFRGVEPTQEPRPLLLAQLEPGFLRHLERRGNLDDAGR